MLIPNLLGIFWFEEFGLGVIIIFVRNNLPYKPVLLLLPVACRGSFVLLYCNISRRNCRQSNIEILLDLDLLKVELTFHVTANTYCLVTFLVAGAS